MNNSMKRFLANVAVMSSLITSADSRYCYGNRAPRKTSAEENSFVEKQGYKEHSQRDRAEQYRRKLKRKNKSYKGHKHGGARK